MSWYKNLSFTQKMLFAMLFGAIVGIFINNLVSFDVYINKYLSHGLFDIVGKIFINSLKMLVVPLVFCSIAVGVTSLGNIALMGRIGLKSLNNIFDNYCYSYFISFNLLLLLLNLEMAENSILLVNFAAKEAPSLSSVITSIIPSNPILAMTEGRYVTNNIFCYSLGYFNYS